MNEIEWIADKAYKAPTNRAGRRKEKAIARKKSARNKRG